MLQCDMKKDCRQRVTHIGEKGFIYCTEHGTYRRVYGHENTRKMRQWELQLLESGKPLLSYKPVRKPITQGAKFISVRTSERPGKHYELVPENSPNIGNQIGHYVVVIHGIEPTRENVSKIRKAINNANLGA